MTLYQLTGQMLDLMELLEDPDVDPEVVNDTMDAVNMELEDKLDSYCVIIKELEAKADMLDKEKKRLDTRQKTVENSIKKLKQRMMLSMKLLGKKKVKTDKFSFTIKSNAPSLKIDDEAKVPAEYKLPQPDKIDSAGLKKFLAGKDTDYAHFEQSESLLIK